MLETIISQPIEFLAFGTGFGIFCNDEKIKDRIQNILPLVIPERLEFVSNIKHEHIFRLHRFGGTGGIAISRNNEEATTYWDEDRLMDYLSSQVRITVAEFAKSCVFVHSGAVGWKGMGIIIPGQSYSGKTTLVSELIKIGADYYSDEYAVLDEDGLLHPYPKMLSMRGIINDYDQVDTEPENFGAAIGRKPLPIGMVLITKFEKNATWNPSILKPGEGVMEILEHTIPIRYNPAFVLKVLKKTASRAIIAKSKRGAADLFAPRLLEYLETFIR